MKDFRIKKPVTGMLIECINCDKDSVISRAERVIGTKNEYIHLSNYSLDLKNGYIMCPFCGATNKYDDISITRN